MSNEFDLLTNVWNRHTVLSHISQLVQQERKVGIALADVDFFINVDSKVGNEEGDRILQRIASFFSKCEGTVAGRYESDEFILVFSGKEQEELSILLDSLRKSFRKQRFISEDSLYAKVPMTVSFGLAVYGGRINSMELLLKSAEIALAMAKKRGRNQVAAATDNIYIISNDEQAEVSTVIGSGLKGYGGDGCYAASARLVEPYGIDLINEEEIIFADRGNHRIRKIRKDGIVENVAGDGTYGYFGDHGFAQTAKLNKPSGIAVTSENHIYIADTGNHCIRKIDKDGTISTLAGCGLEGYEGDGKEAAMAKLSRPGGVVVDKVGNVYTNDYGNNVIRIITKDGIISTVAGSGEFGYKGDGKNPLEAAMDRPYGLAVTQNGEFIYIADYGNNCIRKVAVREHTIHTICGTGEQGYDGDGGNALKAKLNGPYWISLWLDRYLLIADADNNCIRIMNLLTNRIETLAGNGKPGYCDKKEPDEQTCFNIPAGMVADTKNGLLYVADYANNAIRKVKISKLPC
ncbi:NHL domain-containing protein [Pelosinus baikalensis]|uniref:Diguanylate cyclase n=1 Tax=Pelosinus baikalensis TaxID=2892015 RepID=A0ABS8HTL4_9FIRM|nr:diguanylate cyclase [Pelosinus baikalensis]MCC5466513.1 diguanylate cyclase [Pelosinus baikalensis]